MLDVVQGRGEDVFQLWAREGARYDPRPVRHHPTFPLALVGSLLTSLQAEESQTGTGSGDIAACRGAAGAVGDRRNVTERFLFFF